MSLSHFQQKMDKKVSDHRKQIYVEYSRLVSAYMEAKEYLKEGHLLDSYNSIHQSLQHWAKLVIMEVGERQGMTVWEQLREIDPSVYKLYEELVTSQEPLDKRIELLLLALDFSVLSQMENCVQFMLDILSSREHPWRMQEIIEYPAIAELSIDVELLLRKMQKRSLIKEHILLREGVEEVAYSV
ncbi:hypothetical protein [Ammoniphilus sp. YIM 78166]|uniref:hypothetical protein n=1 Tax=Ammoniphilus sp. YIM 78166 TaxID=1644106 RepID=UPI00106F88B5|nr:hypothetical protein [Ammoniphilus sp. YIM 78166]